MSFCSDHPSELEKKDFVSEISLMKRIGFSKHPHVVGLFGCVTVPQPVCILLEYLEYGDLLTYLQNINEEVTINNTHHIELWLRIKHSKISCIYNAA